MRGTKRERSPGVWEVRVYEGTDGRGRPIQRSKTVRGGERLAETEQAKMVANTDLTVRGRGPVTVKILLDRWLHHIGPERAASTLDSYRKKIDKRIVPVLGSKRLEKLTPEDLDRAYRAWLDGGLSPTTVHQYHAILSAALRQAVKWGWIQRNPAERATPPSARRNTAKAPSTADLRRLIAAAEKKDDHHLAAVVTLAALTGVRRGELCALRWSDVNLDLGELSVSRSLTVLNRVWREGPTKTHQDRKLSLDPVALEAIRRRVAAQRAAALEAEIRPCADPFLLSRLPPFGEPCKPDGITQAFRRLCEELGLSHHLHELRHFTATQAIAGGVDIRSVSARLGHADASTTLRIYAGALKAGDQAAADLLGRLLQP